MLICIVADSHLSIEDRFQRGSTFAELLSRPKDNSELWDAINRRATISVESAVSEGLALPKPDRYRHIRTWYARDRGATLVSEILSIIEGVDA